MADVAIQSSRVGTTGTRKRSSLRTALKRKSTSAFLMTLPLILLIGILVIYPAFYSMHLATLNKSMQRFALEQELEIAETDETLHRLVQRCEVHGIEGGIDDQNADEKNQRQRHQEGRGRLPLQRDP